MSAFENYPRITPFLWFDSHAEEAVNFYLSVFKNSRRLDDVQAAGEGSANGPRTIAFELEGQTFTAISGGPYFKFTEAVSFVVCCDTQQEIDDYWAKFTEDGSESQCGWLKDKFGLSWQIVPRDFVSYIRHPKAMQAMLKMKKLNIAELEHAVAS